MLGSRNRSRRESREAVVASLPVDEDGNVPEDFLRRRNNLRSARSRAADDRSTARKVYPRNMPPEQAVSWIMNPGRSDVEGIDCDGKANVKRRETKKSKAKGKEKPATPKAKAPAKPRQPVGSKPKAPEPVQTPSVVLSGREIVDTVKLFTSVTGNYPIHLGYGMYSTNNGSHHISLTRMDGKGLFGLDPDMVADLMINDPIPITKLSTKEIYKISLEGDKLVFRTGKDFSDVSLESRVGEELMKRSGPLPKLLNRTDFETAYSFVPDIPTFRTAVRQMHDTGSDSCYLLGTEYGTYLISRSDRKSRCQIEAQVGGPVPIDDLEPKSVYWTCSLGLMLDGPGKYLSSARFGQDRGLIMEGTFGDYRLLVAVVNVRS